MSICGPSASLAQLYEPRTIPAGLRAAHAAMVDPLATAGAKVGEEEAGSRVKPGMTERRTA